MNILITGSSGQIGTNLALALQSRGAPPPLILGIDKRPNTWTTQIPTLLLDMTHPPTAESLAPALHFKPDLIVHLAAWAKVHQLVKEPDKAFENVAMTHWALELARHTKAPTIFGSSREVYGDVRRHVTDESQADHVIAGSPYSASKIAAEAFFSSYAKCYNLKTLIFRFSNVYGRYDNDLDRMERVIPLFVKKIATDQPITVFGKDKMLDFTYIDDCISGILAGIDKLAPSPSPGMGGGAVPGLSLSNETINLAYGQGQTLYDLVTLIELALNKKANATYAPSQTGEVTRYVADITKARQLLHYSPQTPLTRGILHYVQWCRETNFIP